MNPGAVACLLAGALVVIAADAPLAPLNNRIPETRLSL
jgi:hypothetical protein